MLIVKRFNRQLSGWTLLELLIVIAILGILSSFSYAALNNNRTVVALQASSREVAAAVREAQQYALTGKEIGSGRIPCVFGVSWVSESSYRVDYTSHAVNNSSCNSSGTFATYALKNGVVFSGNFNLDFSLPRAETTPLNPPPIKLQKSNRHIGVCVYEKGKVIETAVVNSAPAVVCP